MARNEKTFELQMMDTGRVPNMLAGAIIACYMFYFSGIQFSELGPVRILIMLSMVLLMAVVGQFLIAPNTNRFITRSISQRLMPQDNAELNDSERTDLVRDLMRCPIKIAVQVTLVFIIIVAVVSLSYLFIIQINIVSLEMFVAGGFFGAYNAGILAFAYAERLCSRHAKEQVQKGIDSARVRREHFYGERIQRRVMFFILIPVVLANMLQVAMIVKGYMQDIDAGRHLLNMFLMILLNSAVTCILEVFLYTGITKSTSQLTATMENVVNNGLKQHVYIPTDLANEIAYNLFSVNEIISYLQSVTANARETADSIGVATERLADVASENASISERQDSSVKECLLSMEDVKELLKDVTSHIIKVGAASEDIRKGIAEGYELLNLNINKMSEITDANLETVAGIKELGEKIESVWEIISSIEHIAEKTRMIAFNAELEATAAGESGQNFHIVANEIRRLAATITESIRDIKESIKKIQESSDNLIVTSEGGTQKIREGSEFFTGLEENFDALKTTSEVTAESYASIEEITVAQDTSFIQISATLRQVSIGFTQFSKAAQHIKDSAKNLRSVALELGGIKAEGEA